MIGGLPKVQDTYLPQAMDLPQLRIDVDRIAAIRSGLTETDVIRNVITTLMSSSQIAPNLWIDPKSNNAYLIGVQYAEHNVDSIRTLEKIPLTSGGRGKGKVVCRLEDVARIERSQGPVEVYHKNVNRVSQLFVSVADNDLAGVASDVERLAKELPMAFALDRLPHDKQHLRDDPDFRGRLNQYLKKKDAGLQADIKARHGVDVAGMKLSADMRIEVRGEISGMRESFRDMAFILLLAVLLVYLVMAAQFSSWLDPLIMIVSAPLGLFGVVFTLWLTGTSLNIQSCMGVLMMIGISVSNSVLMIEFANQLRSGEQDGAERRRGVVHRHGPARDDGPGDAGCHHPGGPHADASHPDDHHRHDCRPAADGDPSPARRRDESAAGPRRDRRPGGLDSAYPVRRADSLHPAETAARREAHEPRRGIMSARSGRMVPNLFLIPRAGEAVPGGIRMRSVRIGRVGLLLPLLAIAGCGHGSGKPPRQELDRLPRLEVVRPLKTNLFRRVELAATVEPMKKVDVCARVPGIVDHLPDKMDIGRTVRAGEVLARLEVPDLEADKLHKEALLAQRAKQKIQAKEAEKVAEREVEEGKKIEKRWEADFTFQKLKYERQRDLVAGGRPTCNSNRKRSGRWSPLGPPGRPPRPRSAPVKPRHGRPTPTWTWPRIASMSPAPR